MPAHPFQCFLFALLASPLTVDASEPCLSRAWQGTLGSAPVTMDFHASSPGGAVDRGAYYYGRSLQELTLHRTDAATGRWEERDAKGRLTGLWRVACDNAHLTGTWTRPDGSGARRLDATEVASYRQRQLSELRFDVRRVLTLDGGRRAEVVGLAGIDEVSGVRIVGSGRGIEAINRKLLARFRENLANRLDCLMYGRQELGPDHGFDTASDTAVVAYSRQLLVFRENDSQACGGAHPAVAEWVWTWDLATAQIEDVSKWLLPANEWPELRDWDQEGDVPEGALARYIRLHSGEESEECRDAVSVTLEGNRMWPSPDGIVVRPDARSYAERACAQEFAVPNDVIRPYLTGAGFKRVRAMRWVEYR